MMKIRKAMLEDIHGIVRVCAQGYRSTYPGLLAPHQIEKVIEDFYNPERVQGEILNTGREWNGWYVAAEDGRVIGAGGGGMTGEETGELFVLYLDPARKREGIGSKLLQAVTEMQMALGAKEQWVSVAKGNTAAIPFYEAMGFRCQGERSAYGFSEEEGLMSLRYMRRLTGGIFDESNHFVL